jgi:hypothetical protein
VSSPNPIAGPSPFSSIGLKNGVVVALVLFPLFGSVSSSHFCRCRKALLTAALRTLFPFRSGLVVAAAIAGKSAVGGEEEGEEGSGTAVAVEEEEVEVEERREVGGQRRLLPRSPLPEGV